MKVIRILIAIVVVAALYFVFAKINSKQDLLASRLWMEYAMDIVRETKPTPPEAARLYATVASVYYKGLMKAKELGYNKEETEDYVNLLMLYTFQYIYSEKNVSVAEYAKKNNISTEMDFGMKTREEVFSENQILKEVKERFDFDNQQKFNKKFVGTEYWVGENPFSPTAPDWKRWQVGSTTFDVPPPPKFKSEEYLEALKVVRGAAASRTTEQVALINFWGGIPGTETPAGIWQNRFYNETKKLNLSNEKYAYVQMILAEALADSFMECWKVKYTYFTKRPSMVDPTIDLAMKDPNFPSYTSGHSNVSATAATVLGVFFPEKKEIFMQDAINAKNSRLWAGIHFPHDNEEGFKLGQKIGQFYQTNVIENY